MKELEENEKEEENDEEGGRELWAGDEEELEENEKEEEIDEEGKGEHFLGTLCQDGYVEHDQREEERQRGAAPGPNSGLPSGSQRG